ncbi:MAG: dihydrolipoyl dehydrogenase [Burkholderiaceae bacterium]|nr:dihydrolipoyl dehydrogenase [Burkholderiaceae bacterium]
MSERYDVIVIGAGPAGYISAIRAAQLGFKVACVEKWKTPSGEMALGGTCLNVGCIPSKALLASSEEYENAAHHLHEHGIEVQGVKVDVAKMVARKDGIVSKMTKGIEFLFRKNKITWLKGHGRFVGAADGFYKIEVSGDDASEVNEARNVIIATGSKSRHLPGLPVDNVDVCDNEGALVFTEVPKRLGVIGAGVIGLELGSVWRRLGSAVTMLEAMPGFLAACDEAVAKECWKIFTKQGLDIQLGVKIGEVSRSADGITVPYVDASGEQRSLVVDKLIVSVGRVPNTDKLGLESIGLAPNERGFIEVDDHCRTAQPGVFAIGDVVRGPMLAHKGEDEGVMVAELIAGQQPHIDYNCIPWVIYTSPEIAWVGRTEQQLKAEGRAYKAGQFPFAANGRALGMLAAEGFVKVLADARTDEVLGVHIIAATASDLIAEAAVAMEFKASAEDIARVCHPHPSMSEVMREAALATDRRALNM